MLGLAAEENVLRIHIDELVFGLIAFAVIFALVYRYAVPRVTKMLDERADALGPEGRRMLADFMDYLEAREGSGGGRR